MINLESMVTTQDGREKIIQMLFRGIIYDLHTNNELETMDEFMSEVLNAIEKETGSFDDVFNAMEHSLDINHLNTLEAVR